jgi:pyruvate dehydrogenase E2 component (dihydrolipoamide acetyltransferase)
MGGAVAVLMALAAPERVASLALLAPGGFGEAINGPLLRRYAAAMDEGEIRDCLAAMSGPHARLPDESVGIYLAMRNRPGQREKLVEIAAAITRDDRQGVIPRHLLATLSMPVAVLWGTHDPVLPVSQAEHLPENFLLRRVPDAGHMLIGEAPGLVSELIRTQIGQPQAG